MGESGRVATYSPLELPLELSLRLCVPASPRALCALTSPGVNILASGMLFSGQRVSELRCERQVAYVLRRLGGSERSTELARSTPTAVSLTTQTSTRTTQTMVLTIIKNKRGRFDGLDTKDKKAAADALSLKTDSVAVWVFDDDSLAIMTKMHQTLATKEVDVTLQTLQSTPEEHKVVLSKPPRSLLAITARITARRGARVLRSPNLLWSG